MEIHHHHHHHHYDADGGSLKSIGKAFKHTFSKSNMEHAGIAAIPAATTSLGAMAGGPLGAAAGAATGYMIDKSIMGHGFGDGLRKGTKAHVAFHLKKLNAAKDKKKYEHSLKNYAKAMHHYENKPYLLLKHDKDHQKNLRQSRKHTKSITPIDFGVDPDEVAGNGLGDGFYHRSSNHYNDASYSNNMNAHMKTLHSASSPWLKHVKAFRDAHEGITYSQALKEAAKTYKKVSR